MHLTLAAVDAVSNVECRETCEKVPSTANTTSHANTTVRDIQEYSRTIQFGQWSDKRQAVG